MTAWSYEKKLPEDHEAIVMFKIFDLIFNYILYSCLFFWILWIIWAPSSSSQMRKWKKHFKFLKISLKFFYLKYKNLKFDQPKMIFMRKKHFPFYSTGLASVVLKQSQPVIEVKFKFTSTFSKSSLKYNNLRMPPNLIILLS